MTVLSKNLLVRFVIKIGCMVLNSVGMKYKSALVIARGLCSAFSLRVRSSQRSSVFKYKTETKKRFFKGLRTYLQSAGRMEFTHQRYEEELTAKERRVGPSDEFVV